MSRDARTTTSAAGSLQALAASSAVAHGPRAVRTHERAERSRRGRGGRAPGPRRPGASRRAGVQRRRNGTRPWHRGPRDRPSSDMPIREALIVVPRSWARRRRRWNDLRRPPGVRPTCAAPADVSRVVERDFAIPRAALRNGHAPAVHGRPRRPRARPRSVTRRTSDRRSNRRAGRKDAQNDKNRAETAGRRTAAAVSAPSTAA